MPGHCIWATSKKIAPFQTFTLDGDYHGERGSLISFNTRLGDDASLTDKLIVRGSISGHSQIHINNLSGAGARTDKGIVIIEAQNAESITSSGAFSLSHRVVAGAFDYFLKQEGNHWLLTTTHGEQRVPLPAAPITPSSEQTERLLPPPKPPRTFTSRTETHQHFAIEATRDTDTVATLNRPAETNQLFVTEVTNNTDSADTPENLAETSAASRIMMADDIHRLAPTGLVTETRALMGSTAMVEEIPPVVQELSVVDAVTDAGHESVSDTANRLDEKEAVPIPHENENKNAFEGVVLHSVPATLSISRQAPLRPEPGIYAANLSAANTLFVTGMHDRIGETTYPGAFLSPDESVYPALWLRVVGGRNKASMVDRQIATHTHSHLVQLGGEIMHIGDEGGEGIRIGLMAGRGQSRSQSRAALTGYEAGGSIEGYALGLYGTWHHDDDDQKGPYLDVSLNYNRFNNRVKGQSLAEERYRSRGFVGGIEGGFHRQLLDGEQVNAYIQPQLHITWMGVRASHTEINGDKFTLLGSGNIQSRLGARFYLEQRIQARHGRQQQFKPFIETNWIHNSRAFGVGINGSRLMQEGGRNIAEVKIGHEGQVNRQVAVWGSLGYQAGGGGFNNTVGTLGIKVRF